MNARSAQFSGAAAWNNASGRPAERSRDDDALSEREQDILLMSALGLCNKSIARRMNVSVRTIESCRSRLRGKLGTGTVNRLEATARIILHGDSARLADLLGVGSEIVESRRQALRHLAN